MSKELTSDPTFTAYCPECDTVKPLENVAHVVRCLACGEIVLGTDVIVEGGL